MSRFEDLASRLVPMRLVQPDPPAMVSTPMAASAVLFVHMPAGWSERHPAPARQWVLVLSGVLEVSAGEDTRRFGSGDAVLAEDTAGPGHTTTAVEDAILGVVRL